MVSTFPVHNMYRQPLTVDTAHAQQKFFEDDDQHIDDAIDHNALDSGLEMSPNMVGSRRASYAASSTMFSPKSEPWQVVDMESVPSDNPFMDMQQSMPNNNNNNPFFKTQQSQQQHVPQAFMPQRPMQWSTTTAAPMPHFDPNAAIFNTASPIFTTPPMANVSPFGNSINQVAMFQNLGSQPMSQSPSTASTVQDHKDTNVVTVRSHNELRRGDGIRKKHTRFEIPAERTLNNIEKLIAESTDESELKELKHQKRLLRNRQAALDSRQRKKQHTERLEDEQKHYGTVIGELEDQLAEMRLTMEQMVMDKENAVSYIEQLKFDKEEMIRAHTNETGELRKKINALTSHVQHLETMPSHHQHQQQQQHMTGGFDGNSFGDMHGMAMDEQWDNMGLFGEVAEQQEQKLREEVASTAVKTELSTAQDGDKSTQGGLLFMLFLVGAFVLSNRTPSIPRVSEDVRVASATLLDNVFKDAGVAQAQTLVKQAATSTSWAFPPSVSMPATGSGYQDLSASVLEQLSDSLTQPTPQQANNQLFSLSAVDYNNIAGHHEMSHDSAPEPTQRQGRRNLADALAAMRTSSKAEVYTRSLLWDQIPSDVVRTFAKMVADTGAHDTKTNNGQHGSNAK